MARALVISPHLDDAALGAASAVMRGGAVATVFAGDPDDPRAGPWDRICGFASSAEAMRTRRAEDSRALAALGCADVVHLGLADDQYGPPADVRAVVEALREVARGATELLAPAGIGGHPDHLLARTAAGELAREMGVGLALYADMPYAVQHGWPAEVSREENDGCDAMAAWRLWLPAAAPAPSVRRLGGDEQRRKRRAARSYATQWRALSGLGVLEAEAFWRYEVFWSVA